MKKLIFTLSLFLSVGCASVVADGDVVPALENRTLALSKTVPGFEYSWRECVKKNLFGRCTKLERRTEFYDLSVPEIREKLINMGFIGKVREKVLP